MPSARPVPYPDDLAYLADLFGWVRLRSRRLEAQRVALESPDEQPPRRGTVGPTTRTHQHEQQRRLAKLKDAEEAARKLLDARVAATDANGRVLGLDSIVQEHDLGNYEKTLLTLGTLVACGDELAGYLQGSTGVGYYGGPVSPEVAWRFCEMGLADRLKSRATLLPTAPLLRSGLIALHVGPDLMPGDLPNANVDVTPPTFARITGLTDLVATTPTGKSPAGDGNPF